MTKLKVLDLFSGLGGISYGLEQTGGFETVAFCDVDETCRKVIRKHWKNAAIYSDVKIVKAESICRIVEDSYYRLKENVDLICGGYPCTGHSVAGKKEGLENEASGLWGEYERIIGEIKPKYVIIENSHNLRSTGLVEVLKALDARGYNAEWQIISGYGTGAPHQRERIYIVAWRRHLPYPNPFRSWATYSKKEKSKQEWWSERRFERDAVFGEIPEAQPRVLRDFDGLPKGLQRDLAERIKQLGNSVIPQISKNIGEALLQAEAELKNS